MIMRDKPAYSLGPHSVSPLRRLAGGRAPSDPQGFRPAGGAASGGTIHPRSPVAVAAAERSPSWPTDRPAWSLVVTGEGLRIRPWAGLWPTGC